MLDVRRQPSCPTRPRPGRGRTCRRPPATGTTPPRRSSDPSSGAGAAGRARPAGTRHRLPGLPGAHLRRRARRDRATSPATRWTRPGARTGTVELARRTSRSVHHRRRRLVRDPGPPAAPGAGPSSMAGAWSTPPRPAGALAGRPRDRVDARRAAAAARARGTGARAGARPGAGRPAAAAVSARGTGSSCAPRSTARTTSAARPLTAGSARLAAGAQHRPAAPARRRPGRLGVTVEQDDLCDQAWQQLAEAPGRRRTRQPGPGRHRPAGADRPPAGPRTPAGRTPPPWHG